MKARALSVPERLQIRRSARAGGRTQVTFERLARIYRVPVAVIRTLVMG
jgi:hypothetical protein